MEKIVYNKYRLLIQASLLLGIFILPLIFLMFKFKSFNFFYIISLYTLLFTYIYIFLIRYGAYVTSDGLIFKTFRNEFFFNWSEIIIESHSMNNRYNLTNLLITSAIDAEKKSEVELSWATEQSFSILLEKYAPHNHELHNIIQINKCKFDGKLFNTFKN